MDENEADANLYSNSVSEESEAVIIPEPVTGIEVANDYQHMGLFVGGSGKIRYSVLPGNATNTNVTFKSLNEKVATVDANGVVTVKKKTGGKKVTITASNDKIKVSASWKVTSMKGIVKKVKITGTKTVKAGKILKLKRILSAAMRC